MKMTKSILASASLAAAMTFSAATPASAFGDLIQLKLHALECSVMLLEDIAQGTSNHLVECGIGGASASNSTSLINTGPVNERKMDYDECEKYTGRTPSCSYSDECCFIDID